MKTHRPPVGDWLNSNIDINVHVQRSFLFYIYGVCKSIQVFIFCCNICVVGKGCTEKFIENPNIRNHKEVKSARDPIVGPPDRPGNRVHCPAPEKFIENPNIR